ncbi:MAG: molybdate ABC transporter substrate-binding protein [Candidatus Acidiferrales bacterium]
MSDSFQPRTQRRPFRRTVLLGLLAAFLCGAAGPGSFRASAKQSASITVSAAISLKDGLDEIAQAYEHSHPGTNISLNYGGSGTLQRQIEQGAPVDVFVSAGKAQMDALESEKLVIAATRRNLVSNELVLIAPANSTIVRTFQDLTRPDVKIIALGDPATVPAGVYAQQALGHLGLLAAIQKKVVYAKDVRQVLTYVETGNADAGMVYQTDARITSKVRVVATAAPASHEPIVYPVAILAMSKNLPVARSFLEFLMTPESRGIFEKVGFTIPEKQAEKS